MNPVTKPNRGLTTTIFEDHINSDVKSFYTKLKITRNYFDPTVSDPDNRGALPWTCNGSPEVGFITVLPVAMPLEQAMNLQMVANCIQQGIDYHPDANAALCDGANLYRFVLWIQIIKLYDDFTSM